MFTKEMFPARVRFPIAKILQTKTSDAMVVCPMIFLCIASSVQSGIAPKKKVTPAVTSVRPFPASTLIISPWLLEKKLFYGPFLTDARLVLKNGCRMRKPATVVRNAATRFSGALSNAIGVKPNWIWIRLVRRIRCSRLMFFHLKFSPLRSETSGELSVMINSPCSSNS